MPDKALRDVNFEAQRLAQGDAIRYGTTVPTDASTGYAPGCIFINVAGAAGSQVYINEGSITSSLFKALTSISGTATLTNKTLTTPALTNPTGTYTATDFIDNEFNPATRVFARSDFGKRIYTKAVPSDWTSFKSVASADLDWFMSGNGTLFGGAVSADGGALISCSNTTKCAFIKPSTGSRFKKIQWLTQKKPRFRAVIKTGVRANASIMVGLYSSIVPKALTLATPYSHRAEILLRASVDSSKWHCRVGGATSASGTGPVIADTTVYDMEIRVNSSLIPSFYINNTLVYTSTVALATGKALVPLIGVASHHASNKKNMQVYHIYMSRDI